MKRVDDCLKHYLEDYWPCAVELSIVDVIGTQVARSDKLGTDPMAYGGIHKRTSPWELGGIPRVRPDLT